VIVKGVSGYEAIRADMLEWLGKEGRTKDEIVAHYSDVDRTFIRNMVERLAGEKAIMLEPGSNGKRWTTASAAKLKMRTEEVME
jgi:hypothetical protein